MSAVRLRETARDDRGLTLVELLVTMTLALVVLLGVLSAGDALLSGTSKVDRRADVQDQARRALADVIGQLRDARPIAGTSSPLVTGTPLPSRSSIVFSARLANGDAPGTVTGWVRVCATATTGRAAVLIGRRLDASYADPGSCDATNTVNGWSYGRLLVRDITDGGRLFDFASDSCVGASCTPSSAVTAAAVRTIGVNLSIDPGHGNTVYTLRGAATIRNRT